jgi:hypothetical protein
VTGTLTLSLPLILPPSRPYPGGGGSVPGSFS